MRAWQCLLGGEEGTEEWSQEGRGDWSSWRTQSAWRWSRDTGARVLGRGVPVRSPFPSTVPKLGSTSVEEVCALGAGVTAESRNHTPVRESVSEGEPGALRLETVQEPGDSLFSREGVM